MSESERNLEGSPSAEDLNDLYENAPCGYLSIQPNGRIFKINLTLSTWLGYSQEQLVGMHLHDLLNMAGRIFFETHFAPLLRMQGFFNEVALDLVTQQGGRLPVLVNANERRDANGNHLFTRLTVFNATDRRRYERDLLNARTAAEAAQKELLALNAIVQARLLDEARTSSLREEFIAVLGHDLRNPLAAIEAGLQLLLKERQTEKAHRVIGLMKGSAARMAGLIDDVLDFARGRLGGGLALERKADAPIEAILRQIVAELQTAATRVIETTITLTSPVDCDPRRVGQLASNLLGNALTHGASDRPVRMGAATAHGRFELFVANEGEPIPPPVLPSIFEPFKRGEHRPSRQGLGLGLYIAREIARAHGGTLDVVSTNEETRFTFRMPLVGQ